jgi:Ser/Thr protein kinase RdoA (MazF antagonist)
MLTQVLSEQYGLTNPTVTPAPRGFIAETYYIDTHQGRCFAKLVKISRDSETISASLPVLLELRQLGIERINTPIPAQDGRLSTIADGKMLVLFNYVAGQWTLDYPFEPYVRLLGQIHQLSDRIQTPLARAAFDLPFRDELLAHLDQMWTGCFNLPQEKALQAWTISHHGEIVRDFAMLEQTASMLKSTEPRFFLTHGDAMGNVLYDGKQVTIVDWDTVLSAPPERDTWFHLHQESFLPLYREFVPGYTFDMTACRYYLYMRYFEDLEGYIDKVLSPESSDAEKTHNFEELVKTCDEWLRPLMEMDRVRDG